MRCCIPGPRRRFLSTEVKVYVYEPAMVLMNCKFSSLLSETMASSKDVESIIGNRGRLPNFFRHCLFRVDRECWPAGALGGVEF